MGQVVKCPDCQTAVELPDVLKPGKKYLCPDCDTRLPVAADPPRPKPKVRVADDDEDDRPAKRRSRRDDDDDDDRPRRKAKKPADDESPFWKTRAGKILGGVGFLLLGAVLIGVVILLDPRKPVRGYALGGICILLGLFSIGSGLFTAGEPAADPDEDDDEDDDE